MERCDGGGGDKIAPPDQRGRTATDVDRPHLIQRQTHVITTTRVVEGIGSLIRSVRPRTTVGSAEGKHALFICREQLPKKFRPERTGSPSDSRAVDQSGELPANLILLPEQPVELLGRPNRLFRVVVGQLGRAAARGKGTRTTTEHVGPKS